MAIDVSGINFFMPVFSFLFVFVIVYAILAKTKILGDNKFVNLVIGFIMAIIFMSFSSTELYVETIIPWAAFPESSKRGGNSTSYCWARSLVSSSRFFSRNLE